MKKEENNLKMIFIGTPRFGAIVLDKISNSGLKPFFVITYPDKPAGRGLKRKSSPVKRKALELKIPILEVTEMREMKEKIKNYFPDIILVSAFGKIIPKEILDIPEFGVLNLHPSLLPKYRGPSPIQQAILDGKKETGVTVIKMTEKLDAGPIIAQEKMVIKKNIKYRELEKELAILGAEMLVKVIPDWMEGKIIPKDQNEKMASYTRVIKKEDGKIDWSEEAELIERKVRAFEEWPKAYTFLEKKRYIILEGRAQKEAPGGPNGEFGKIYLAPNNKLAVQCKNSYFIIEKIKPEGKREMKIEDFLKGHIDIIGKKFN